MSAMGRKSVTPNATTDIIGTPGDDTLNGGKGEDTIHGYCGDDTLNGGKGNDTLYGGDGNDELRGKKDDDTLDGGSGIDALYGEKGNDTLYGGSENDTLDGDKGNDTLYGGAGDDTLTGGKNADIFVLNTDGSGTDTVTDFTPDDDDKIRVYVDDVTEIDTLEDLNLRVGKGHINVEGLNSLTDKGKTENTAIYDTQGTATDTTDDVLIMVLEDFTTDLTIDMFEVMTADDAEEPSIIEGIQISDDFQSGVPENTDASTSPVVATVNVHNTDDTHTYRITEGNDCGLFAINANGEITLAGALDYETASSHTLTIEARNSDDVTDTDEITIDVDNVNEGKATVKIMINGEDEADVDLVSAGDTLTVDFDIEDPDGMGPNANMTYRWFHKGNAAFTIDDSGNEYTVKGDDVGKIIGVEVRYTDNVPHRDSVVEVMYLTVGTRLIRPPADEIDNDNTISASPDESSQIEGGDGSDTITDGTGNDIIEGGLGDDTIDLGADASGSDSDTVIYGIGGQTAQDGGDDITNFNRGKDKFVFSLESNTETRAITNLDELFTFITKGTETVYDDEFLVHLDFDFSGDAPALDGVNFHFTDGVFYSGGRISMPIVEIDFAESSVIHGVENIIAEVFGNENNLREGLNPRAGILTDLDYLNALFGGDDEFEAIGFQIVEPDMV